MKKVTDKGVEMRGEYDFSRGVPGKSARRYAQGANVVVLEADVAKVFPNAKAVNDSLRALAAIIRRQHKTLATRQAILVGIARVLARHYSFTAEELDFILNYDIKYRLGRDPENEEEE